MNHYNLIIIGFGKAGKTIAKFASEKETSIAVIEESKKMYGGTCINVGCIPSKTLIHAGKENLDFLDAIDRKKEVVKALNKKNYDMLANVENIKIFDNKARFKSNTEIELLDENGSVVDTITGDKIIINTGAEPIIPKLKGLEESKFTYTSETIMELAFQPKNLIIIGGGYISLEFASMFANFGTKVTIIEKGDILMPREDQEVVELIKEDLQKENVEIILDAEVQEIRDKEENAEVITSKGNFTADAILVAIGRKPNVDLGLENTDIKLGDKGEISVNEHLQTTVENIFAVGDVKGGLQFTYISLDDFRILKDKFYGNGTRTTENRGEVPYSVFITPPLSRIGLTSTAAKNKNIDFIENKLLVNSIPRHKIDNDARGIFKVVVDKNDRTLLGATLYGNQSEELINILKLAMDQKIKIDVLRDNIYTHPTMAEAFNDLFKI